MPATQAAKPGTLDAVIEWINRHPFSSFSVLSLFYWFQASRLALERMLWNDELFTLYDTRQANPSDIWNLLQTSAKAQTPVVLWSIQWLSHHFGDSPFVLRIPGLIFFWIALAGIYWIVTKRASVVWGISAALFAMSTTTFLYAAEARSYGMALGTSALALACWLRAARRGRPAWAPVALAFSIFLVTASHYYSALAPCALAVAEVVRNYRRRRVDWPIWAALSAVVLPILWFLPLIQGARPNFSHFWSPPRPMQLIHTLDFVFGPDRGALLAVALIAVMCLARLPARQPREGSELHEIELHEWVAFWAFVFLPVAGWLLAATVTHGYVERYVLQPLVGISIVLALGLSRLFGRSQKMAIVSAGLLLAGCVGSQAVLRRNDSMVKDELQEIQRFIERTAPAGLPVALGFDQQWLSLTYYRLPARTHDYVYLYDVDLSLLYLKNDGTEINFRDHGSLYPSLYSYREFVARKQPFLVFSAATTLKWLPRALLAEHWNLRLIGESGAGVLYLAEAPKPAEKSKETYQEHASE
jgi:hypothetical protein